MSSLNKVMLHGNLTSDPEVKAAKNGRNVATFSVATDYRWRNKEGSLTSSTDFHRIVAFGKLADTVATYFKKGMPVIVSGRLTNRSYIGQDGGKRYITEVVLNDFNFVSGGKKKTENPAEINIGRSLEKAPALS